MEIINNLKSMNLSDIIQSGGVLTTFVFSFIALIQSIRAKKESKKAEIRADKANELAHKALNDAQKDYIPLLRFVNRVDVMCKSIFTLRNEITFDFDGLLYYLYGTNEEIYLTEDTEIVCVTVEIENCGRGIITGVRITDFFIQSGNKVSIDICAQEELDCLCNIENRTSLERFIILPQERVPVNFIITGNVMERENSDFEWAEDWIIKYPERNENFMISASLEINSLNDSTYNQKYLWGTYVNRELVLNAFDKAGIKNHNTDNI